MIQIDQWQDETVPAFGVELLRGVLLPDFLGKDTPQMLYWAGKNIARQYPLQNFEEITSFFHRAGWGTLTLEKEKSTELHALLSSATIEKRFTENSSVVYSLEAGFLAQQLQQQLDLITECYVEASGRKKQVFFKIVWDYKDSVE